MIHMTDFDMFMLGLLLSPIVWIVVIAVISSLGLVLIGNTIGAVKQWYNNNNKGK